MNQLYYGLSLFLRLQFIPYSYVYASQHNNIPFEDILEILQLEASSTVYLRLLLVIVVIFSIHLYEDTFGIDSLEDELFQFIIVGETFSFVFWVDFFANLR